ncbi:MAG: hypothetical protein P9M15_03720, partial [Candidatus Electryoneaceae bacterium]|nr:hypothetical protein [Candidatus Electryoneaceae bacterium]
GDTIKPYSAGIEKQGMNRNAVVVMSEVGVDISLQRSKFVDEFCPTYTGKTKVIHCGFDDPPKLAQNAQSRQEELNDYRRVRDEIKRFIESLPERLLAEGDAT